jgi:hypothetical protein
MLNVSTQVKAGRGIVPFAPLPVPFGCAPLLFGMGRGAFGILPVKIVKASGTIRTATGSVWTKPFTHRTVAGKVWTSSGIVRVTSVKIRNYTG